MAVLTLAEAQAELTTINAAISEIYQGKRRTHLKIGSGQFAREYNFMEPQKLLEILIEERDKLRVYISGFDVGTTPVFRTNANIPLVVGKY